MLPISMILISDSTTFYDSIHSVLHRSYPFSYPELDSTWVSTASVHIYEFKAGEFNRHERFFNEQGGSLTSRFRLGLINYDSQFLSHYQQVAGCTPWEQWIFTYGTILYSIHSIFIVKFFLKNCLDRLWTTWSTSYYFIMNLLKKVLNMHLIIIDLAVVDCREPPRSVTVDVVSRGDCDKLLVSSITG